jgi:hypothetical protein
VVPALCELQSKGYPFPSGQDGAPTRSTAQLQLFPVSLSITHSYEPRNSPPCRPRLLQQLHVLATAALRLPTAASDATTSPQHHSRRLLTQQERLNCLLTRRGPR